MTQASFVQLYSASLNNLIHPVDQELEEQFLLAKTAVSRVQGLYAEWKKLNDQLDALAVRHQVKKLLPSADDPITRCANLLNECTGRYESLRASGKITISDVSKSCFGSKDIGIAQKCIADARELVTRLTDFYQIVFHQYDALLFEARSRITSVQADLKNTDWSSCESALRELKGQLDGSTQPITLTEAARLSDSLAVQKLDQLFAKLVKQCQTFEKEQADREEAARKAKAERLQQENERKRKLAEQEKERQRREQAAEVERRRLAVEQKRLRELEEQARAQAEQAQREHTEQVAQFVNHLRSLSQGSNIAINLIILLVSLSLLYFFVSDFIAFDSAFIAAVLYALFGLAEAQGNLDKIKSDNLHPNFWMSTQEEDGDFVVFLVVAMFIQLLGGLLYAFWNWLWPVAWTWVGIIFPHTWSQALWYLLLAPMSLICMISIPACYYNLRIVSYARQLLKTYAAGG